MSYHALFATLVTFTAFVSYLNDRYVKLPKTMGLTIISIVIAISAYFTSHFFDEVLHIHPLLNLVSTVDFKSAVLDVMLGYLLFASGLHVNSIELRKEIFPVVYLASLGVVISTFISGYLLYWLSLFFKLPFSLGECLIFGAIISPTDAIAVLGTFKTIPNPPQRLKTLITGEGLFNDAGAILMLVILVQVVYSGVHVTVLQVAESLILETGGGIVWGILVGAIASRFLKHAKSPEVATLMSVAASSAGYVLAGELHVSGVITMVVAGLIIGGYNKKAHFSAETTLVLTHFWELIDEVLNAFLFVLIGLTTIKLHIDSNALILGCFGIFIVFIARLLSIWAPDFITSLLFWRKSTFSCSKSTLMAWGGIRGGLSIALALSIDGFPEQLVAVTYVVVVVSILVQGGTFKWAIKKFA